jgi:hypothetical protein
MQYLYAWVKNVAYDNATENIYLNIFEPFYLGYLTKVAACFSQLSAFLNV